MKDFIKCTLISLIIITVFFATFFMAYLQESYRLCPPTEAEIAEHPILIKFIMGDEK